MSCDFVRGADNDFNVGSTLNGEAFNVDVASAVCFLQDEGCAAAAAAVSHCHLCQRCWGKKQKRYDSLVSQTCYEFKFYIYM